MKGTTHKKDSGWVIKYKYPHSGLNKMGTGPGLRYNNFDYKEIKVLDFYNFMCEEGKEVSFTINNKENSIFATINLI